MKYISWRTVAPSFDVKCEEEFPECVVKAGKLSIREAELRELLFTIYRSLASTVLNFHNTVFIYLVFDNDIITLTCSELDLTARAIIRNVYITLAYLSYS